MLILKGPKIIIISFLYIVNGQRFFSCVQRMDSSQQDTGMFVFTIPRYASLENLIKQPHPLRVGLFTADFNFYLEISLFLPDS